MATQAPPPRAYRAACPNCGAPVDFASAASASAVCSFCRSTLLRDGAALRRIGVSAELFDDHSPLQLGASGRRQGLGFTLVGRLQYGFDGGTWNVWNALFDNGRSAWLSEDNGAYVIAFDAPLPADAPALYGLRVGTRVVADGRAWDVASVERARLSAAEGELPSPPRLDSDFTVADLRNADGEVATLEGDADAAAVQWSVGRAVRLADLQLQGLRDGVAEKTLGARTVPCPNCGAALALTLATTKSIGCVQCSAVVDVSQDAGADLAFFVQHNTGEGGAAPQIALGSSGTLALDGAPAAWQVVGYLERCDIPEGEDEDTTFWREYLLHERTLGFAFLVDANDGWSWVRPITGAPALRGDDATWQDVPYRKRWSYAARVTWVQGEFYWRVAQGERALVTDYEGLGADAQHERLSREQTGSEVTWSAGQTLQAALVADAFGIAPVQRAALDRDPGPVSAAGGGPLRAILVFVAIAVVIMVLLSRCSRDDCVDARRTFGEASAEYRQCARNAGSRGGGFGGSGGGGGSYGGYSSGGGGHK